MGPRGQGSRRCHVGDFGILRFADTRWDSPGDEAPRFPTHPWMLSEPDLSLRLVPR